MVWKQRTFEPRRLKLAGHVHQAAEVAGEQQVGAGTLDRLRLLPDDGVGDRRVLDAEGAAEAAADVVAVERAHLEAVDAPPAGVAAGRGRRARADPSSCRGRWRWPRAAGPSGVAEHVDEEAGDLVGLRGQAHGAGTPDGVLREKLRIAVRDGAGAGARRRDEIIVGLEGRDHLAREGRRVGVVAAVAGGLAAAGLLRRHLDRASGLLEQLQGGEADLRPDRVDEAGDEQPDAAEGVADLVPA